MLSKNIFFPNIFDLYLYYNFILHLLISKYITVLLHFCNSIFIIKKEKHQIIHKRSSVLSNHLSRLTVASKLKRHTTWRDGPPHKAITRSCSRWGLHSRYVSIPLVSSYHHLSTLTNCFKQTQILRFSGGISLLHYPSSRLDWPLASTLPFGAPTFLSQLKASSDCTYHSQDLYYHKFYNKTNVFQINCKIIKSIIIINQL